MFYPWDIGDGCRRLTEAADLWFGVGFHVETSYTIIVFSRGIPNSENVTILFHLWFAGVRKCPPWCSIVGATVTVHQFFCIVHFLLHLWILDIWIIKNVFFWIVDFVLVWGWTFISAYRIKWNNTVLSRCRKYVVNRCLISYRFLSINFL